MANDDFSLSTERSNQRPVAILPGNISEHGNGDWNGMAAPLPAPAMDIKIYLHALRRHWLMALGIGLACAAIVGPTVWWFIGDRYTATSTLRIFMQEKPLVEKNQSQTMDRDRFEIYKNTQQQSFYSRFLLLAALRKPEVTKLAVIQDLTKKSDDPVEWVSKRLGVSFPLRAEVMNVSLTHVEPQEAKILVKAIVDSYMSEVVNTEQDLKRNRLSELERVCSEKELEIRNKRQTFKSIAENTGTGDSDALTIKTKLMLEELTLYRSEMAKTQFESRRCFGELAAQKALLANTESMEVPASELEFLVQIDPQAKRLGEELGLKTLEVMYTKPKVATGVKSQYFSRYEDELNMLQEQYDKRIEEVRKRAQEKRRLGIALEVLRLETLLSTMQSQQESVAKEIYRMQNEAMKIGTSSVEIEMLKSDLRHLETAFAELTNEQGKVRVELHSSPRVIVWDEAQVSPFPSNAVWRIVIAVLSMCGVFCFPVAVIALWDSQSHRINTSEDITRGLQLPVIGSVPLIPARVIRQLGTPSKKNQTWHMRLTESVDGIAARILRKADMEQSRVIMVSSATGGEGKTTLATQLAMSLARTGRSTVLVDFDLRRPSFDEVFGVSLEPGVSEALRHEHSVSDLVHPTGTDNLSVLTAGRWNRQALASLSNGSAADLFKQLREHFEFVVIDTSPILPVADARFISQHVDSVVLSVFRDVSEAPKIRAACDILAAFGVQSVEAVVTGPNTNSYGKLVEYESTISA
jgi:polysaccharide biosynthesis transport protein